MDKCEYCDRFVCHCPEITDDFLAGFEQAIIHFNSYKWSGDIDNIKERLEDQFKVYMNRSR